MYILIPITAPPSFDLEQSLDTIDRLIALDASLIYFSHFSTNPRVRQTFDLAKRKLQDRVDLVNAALRVDGVDGAIAEIIAQCCAELEPVKEKMKALYDFWSSVSIPVSARGFMKYYLKKHQNQ